jgi:hypothetical protein
VLLVLLALGCAEDLRVELDGIVVESSDSTVGLAGATTTFLDEDGRDLGSATTNDLGEFSVELPSGTNVFVLVDADGYVTSVFPGVIGEQPTQQVDGYALYGTSVEEYAALLATWDGCPGVLEDTFLVVGEMKIFGLTDVTGNSPTVNTGIASLTGVNTNTVLGGCYLTDDGAAYDPDAERTGDSGGWLVAPATSGGWALEVAYEYGLDAWESETYPVWAPTAGPAVSPWYPAWVEFAR